MLKIARGRAALRPWATTRHGCSTAIIASSREAYVLDLARINGRRGVVERLDQGDWALGDHVPVVAVEIVEHPRADGAAEQPDEDSYADEQFHRELPSKRPHATTFCNLKQCERIAAAAAPRCRGAQASPISCSRSSRVARRRSIFSISSASSGSGRWVVRPRRWSRSAPRSCARSRNKRPLLTCRCPDR